MSTDFANILEPWHDFFATVAGLSGTLLGLLFVAMSLNPAIMTDDGPTGLRVWSGVTFHSFLVLLVIGIVGLVPSDARTTFVITLLIRAVSKSAGRQRRSLLNNHISRREGSRRPTSSPI